MVRVWYRIVFKSSSKKKHYYRLIFIYAVYLYGKIWMTKTSRSDLFTPIHGNLHKITISNNKTSAASEKKMSIFRQIYDNLIHLNIIIIWILSWINIVYPSKLKCSIFSALIENSSACVQMINYIKCAKMRLTHYHPLHRGQKYISFCLYTQIVQWKWIGIILAPSKMSEL